MVRPYDMDLRERVVAAVEAGESRRSAARRFGVSASIAVKWLQRVAATGSVKPSKMGGYRRPALEDHREWVLARIAEKADVTLTVQQSLTLDFSLALSALSAEVTELKAQPPKLGAFRESS